jgi:hypothetical protein
MDFDELKNAYYNATHVNNVWTAPNPKEAVRTLSPAFIEVDYSIIHMPDGTFVVGRSWSLGSLDYDFVFSCTSRNEAHEIVRLLSK